MKMTGVWDSAKGSDPKPHLETTCCCEDNSSNTLSAGKVLNLEDWSGKRTGVQIRASLRTPVTKETAHPFVDHAIQHIRR